MKLRRYILSLILPVWIRLGCPPSRLHLLSVHKLKTKGFQHVPVSVVIFKNDKYIVGLERSRNWVQNVRKANELLLTRGSNKYAYIPIEITDKDTWVMVMKLYLQQEPYTQTFFGFNALSSDEHIFQQRNKHVMFRLICRQ